MKKNNFLKLLLLIAFSVLYSTGCSSATPKFGIVFSAELDGNQDIYRMYGLDIETLERLTFTPIDPEGSLTPTKDGNQILFAVPSPGIERIQAESLVAPDTYAHAYLLDVKTEEIVELNDLLGLFPSTPLTWSIDETSFILAENNYQQSFSRGIYIVNNVIEKDFQELLFPRQYTEPLIKDLSYSYDGEQIAYEEIHPFSGAPPDPIVHSYVYDFSSKTVLLIGDESIGCRDPKWSPTRKQILLSCNLSNDGITVEAQIRILNIEDETVQIIEFFDNCFNPMWSPDGEQIAMLCRDEEKKQGIFLANFDGTNYREILANIPYYTPYLLWSPDGGQLIYSGGEDSTAKRHIYIVNIDGTNNHVITQEPANYGNLFVYEIGR